MSYSNEELFNMLEDAAVFSRPISADFLNAVLNAWQSDLTAAEALAELEDLQDIAAEAGFDSPEQAIRSAEGLVHKAEAAGFETVEAAITKAKLAKAWGTQS